MACSPFDEFAQYRFARSDAGPAESCQSAAPPSRANVVTGAGNLEITLATRSRDYGEETLPDGGGAYQSLGYDLDLACTSKTGPTTCVAPVWADPNPVDGEAGRDNALGAVLYQANQLARSTTMGATTANLADSASDDGSITMLIRVRNYNGMSADDAVEVAVLAASMHSPEGPQPRPNWDGRDEWHALDSWISATSNKDPGEEPLYRDEHAYVTGGTLVAKFSELLFPTGLMRWAVLTGKLVRDAEGAWSLTNGIIAGRQKADDLLLLFQFLQDAAGPVCFDSIYYGLFKARLCNFADIAYDGSNNHSAPCNALSWAWSFNAEAAVLRGVVPTSMIKNAATGCIPAVAPANDTCDTLKQNLAMSHSVMGSP